MYNETFINGIFEFTVTHKGENILTIRVPGREFSRVLELRQVAKSMAKMAKWPKSFSSKGLGPRGVARLFVSPYATRIYVKRFSKVLFDT